VLQTALLRIAFLECAPEMEESIIDEGNDRQFAMNRLRSFGGDRCAL
jgi:hypothetical protein